MHTHTNTHTHARTSFTDGWQVLMCISGILFPGELIKIRVRRALNIAAFCLNKQRLLVIGFTLREVFKTTLITKTSCRLFGEHFVTQSALLVLLFLQQSAVLSGGCLSTSRERCYEEPVCQSGIKGLSPPFSAAGSFIWWPLKCTIRAQCHFSFFNPYPL